MPNQKKKNGRTVSEQVCALENENTESLESTDTNAKGRCAVSGMSEKRINACSVEQTP